MDDAWFAVEAGALDGVVVGFLGLLFGDDGRHSRQYKYIGMAGEVKHLVGYNMAFNRGSALRKDRIYRVIQNQRQDEPGNAKVLKELGREDRHRRGASQ